MELNDTTRRPFGFNPLFAGLTLKVHPIIIFNRLFLRFQSPICGADAQSKNERHILLAVLGFNPLFAGLTLKDAMAMVMEWAQIAFQSPICGADAQSPWASSGQDDEIAVSIPYLRG